MQLNNVLEGLLYPNLKIKNRGERVDENIEHGLLNRVVSILGLRAENKTICGNHI